MFKGEWGERDAHEKGAGNLPPTRALGAFGLLADHVRAAGSCMLWR